MKKLGVLNIAFILALSLSGVTSAAGYSFSDTNGKWGGDGIWETDPNPDLSGMYGYRDAWHTHEFSLIQFDKSCLLFVDGGDKNGWYFWWGDNNHWWGHNNHWWGHNNHWWGHNNYWWSDNKPHWSWRPERPKDESPSPVPEPSTMILLGMGVVGIAGIGYKKIFKRE